MLWNREEERKREKEGRSLAGVKRRGGGLREKEGRGILDKGGSWGRGTNKKN